MKILQLAPRYWRLNDSLAQYAERETWSARQVQDYQLERLNSLWEHAQRYVTHYRELAQELHLPARFDSLDHFSNSLPVLSKAEVRSQPMSFLSERKTSGSWLRSSGSTGEPTRVFWSKRGHRTMLHAKYRSEQAHGLDFLDRKIFFWGHDATLADGWLGTVQRWLRPWQDRLRNRLRLPSYELTPARLEAYLKRAQAFRPSSVYGCSSAIDLLAQTAQALDFRLPSLKLAILTGEPADANMQQRVEQGLKCPTVIEYGAAECGLIAYQMPDRTLRTRDDVVFVETIANQHDSYDILVTALENLSFPLLRYRIEDTTSTMHQKGPQGFGILKDVQGRSNDILITRSGKRLHSMALRHRLEAIPEIRRFTANQGKCGSLRVTLEATTVVSATRMAELQVMLSDLLEGYPVNVELAEIIPANPAGKHRWIVSQMSCIE